MKCWICWSEAKTGEHLIKASDLKSEFGKVTQQAPLYMHTEDNKNVKINSIKKFGDIKSNALLCANCNNARTAPFDKAWEALSKYFRGMTTLNRGDILQLEKIFPGSTKIQMLNVHLYFVKLFGCAIEEYKVPIDIDEFRESILQKKPHPNVYISFGASNGMLTGNTDLRVETLGGRCAFAIWFYVIGRVAVNIMYAEPNEKRQGLIDAWHPNTVMKRIKLTKYQT